MVVTFCGHSEVDNQDLVRSWLAVVIRQLIAQGATHFYSGGYGQFDRMVASAVKHAQQAAPHIHNTLVLAYLNNNPYTQGYDDTVYPQLELVPKRFAILKRNQWMVEQADVVVAYVTYSWGGAAKTLTHAKRKKTTILIYPDLSIP